MVKAVQTEEGVEGYFDGLLKDRVQAQVGLLVGKAAVGSRDIVLAVVPTPTQDGEQVLTVSTTAAAAKPAKKGKSSEPGVLVSLDAEARDWVAAHAQQVAKMLPGGLAVLGLYLFAADSGFSSASSQLCEVLLAIAADAASSSGSSSTAAAKAAAAAAAATAACAGSGAAAGAAAELPASRPQELLLLHVDAVSRKFSMRSCSTSSSASPAAAASGLKPCELKFGPSLPQLLCLRCCHSFKLQLPAAAAAGAQVQQLLQEAASREAARVLSAVAAIDGRVIGPGSTQAVADTGPGSAGSDFGSATAVELYCLPDAAAALAPGGASASSASSNSSSSSSSFAGTVSLQGSIEALAYVHKRDPISKAIAELKADVVRSLTTRVQLLLADAADAAAEAIEAGADAGPAAHPLLAAAASAGKRVRCGLPCRVLLPWAGLNLQVCDYLSDGEAPAAAADRAQQLLHLGALAASDVTQLEGPAAKKQKVVAGSAAGKGGSGGSGAACSGPVLAAAGAAVVAAAAMGVAMMSLG